jgi:hypothetical protein
MKAFIANFILSTFLAAAMFPAVAYGLEINTNQTNELQQQQTEDAADGRAGTATVSGATGGGGTGEATDGSVIITKKIDTASPSFFAAPAFGASSSLNKIDPTGKAAVSLINIGASGGTVRTDGPRLPNPSLSVVTAPASPITQVGVPALDGSSKDAGYLQLGQGQGVIATAEAKSAFAQSGPPPKIEVLPKAEAPSKVEPPLKIEPPVKVETQPLKTEIPQKAETPPAIGGPIGLGQNLVGGIVGGGPGVAPPSGSYAQSCTDCTLTGNTLSCQCGGANWTGSGGINSLGLGAAIALGIPLPGVESNAPPINPSIPTSIDITVCPGQTMTNSNGTLGCTFGGGPQGSYVQTCESCRTTASTLSCDQCLGTKNNAPYSASSSINWTSCSGPIINANTNLQCPP